MPNRVWGYDKDGELHSFVGELPDGFLLENPADKAKPEKSSKRKAKEVKDDE